MSYNNSSLQFPGVAVTKVNYQEILLAINYSIGSKEKLLITYANAYSILNCATKPEVASVFRRFNIVHPDGTGTFLASRFLYGKTGLEQRISGSDFYPILMQELINKSFSVFIFGDTEATLSAIFSRNTDLKISGKSSGYGFTSHEIINSVNLASPDILPVGLGSPKQEEWIADNKDSLNVPVIISVGEGLKVFAGTKIRGPHLLRFFGFEWLARLLSDPVKFWRRYIFGIPLFILLILKFKNSVKK